MYNVALIITAIFLLRCAGNSIFSQVVYCYLLMDRFITRKEYSLRCVYNKCGIGKSGLVRLEDSKYKIHYLTAHFSLKKSNVKLSNRLGSMETCCYSS